MEVDNCISFLDVKVERLAIAFETGLFRKDTFTGLSPSIAALYQIDINSI